MKRIGSFVFLLVLTLGLLVIPSSASPAEGNAPVVTVTICDGNGLVLINESVSVTDVDGDEMLTLNDALFLAHEAGYTGGADAGYAYAESQYGLSLTKLWGIEGGAFGYMLNHAGANSLSDEVANGDYIAAYVYSDTVTWSDTYCYFEEQEMVSESNLINLTLLASGYDANWSPVTLPLEGATITVNGVATDYRTDADGKVTVELSGAADAKYVISATHEEMLLVPPVCVVTLDQSEVVPGPGTNPAPDQSGDQDADDDNGDDDGYEPMFWLIAGGVMLAVILIGVVLIVREHKKR